MTGAASGWCAEGLPPALKFGNRMRVSITMRLTFVVLAALALCAAPTLAHDYWLEPDAFFLSTGKNTRVHLFLGDAFGAEEERPLQRERTPQFRMYSAGGEQDLLASPVRDGRKPVAVITPSRPGNYLIAMERDPWKIRLGAKKFTEYLREEGLDEIVRRREQAGEQRKEGRERYSRHLKALVQVGDLRDDTFGRVLGHRLEIMPEVNPYGLKRGDVLRVRVLFEGRPLKGALVSAYNKGRGTIRRQEARTSGDGVSSFTLSGTGRWLVRLVHMRRCEADCDEVDWESFWAAYSFGMRPSR